MTDNRREYLKLLSEKYPNQAAVRSQLINLKSILALPKGTEHFISDLHGEYEAVRHVLNNCSGVIMEKTRLLFGDTLGEERCRRLSSLICYPEETMNYLSAKGELTNEFMREAILCQRELSKNLSGKYTRSYLRRYINTGHEFVLDELLNMQSDEDENRAIYNEAIISSIIETGAARSVISEMAELIKRLAVEKLHVVGDIYDRGERPELIVDMLMELPGVDIQWGNHDILWLGAASGCPACVAAVLRICLDYGNMSVLERGYGISLRPLTEFCEKVYGSSKEKSLQLSLSILGFKLEGAIILRQPDFEMDDRLLLGKIDFESFTVDIGGKTHSLNTKNFPTVDPKNPYELTPEEKNLIDEYVSAFTESRLLHRHMEYIFKNGSTYLQSNGNLIFHGCIPLTKDGDLDAVRLEGSLYSGRRLLDYADKAVARAFALRDETALDIIWYLWCGEKSPFSGRSFHTFELALIDDKDSWTEPRNPYFSFWENEAVIEMLLSEFGLDPKSGHIINGHTPVKAKKGESPVKAGGRLFIIDGGFCKAYQKTTGIAGYTLIYNSHGLRLKAHRPFSGLSRFLEENEDTESDCLRVETFPKRLCIADTDDGPKLSGRIEALSELLKAYRTGDIPEPALDGLR